MATDRFYLSMDKAESFPRLAELLAALENQEDLNGNNSFEAHRAALDSLLQSGELEQILVQMAAGAADEPDFAAAWISPMQEEWVIADTKSYSFRAFVARPQTKSALTSLSGDVLLGNLSGPEFRLNRYKIPDGTNIEILEKGLALTELPDETETAIGFRSSVFLRADQDVVAYRPTAPTVLVVLYPKLFAPLIWLFDTETKAAFGATSATDTPVRLQTAASILENMVASEELPSEASLEYLANLSKSPHHFVRWTAIQGLCAIDFEAGHRFLLEACDDPHPFVAKAAANAANQYAPIIKQLEAQHGN